jgi:flagellar protein FlgJ
MKILAEMPSLSGTEAGARKTSQLADAAQQFEASMLQELLKPMQDSKGSWGGDEAEEDNSSDTLRSFGTEAVAKSIAQAGGFGIAKQVISQINLEHQRSAAKAQLGTKAP